MTSPAREPAGPLKKLDPPLTAVGEGAGGATSAENRACHSRGLPPQPGVPFVQPLAGAGGQLERRDLRIDLRAALAIARDTSKSTCGKRSILLRIMRSAARNMCGYFSGLSSPSVTERITDLGALAEIEQRRADEIADVLDHDDGAGGGPQFLQPARDHVGFEMASRPGVDLHRRGARGADALAVDRRSPGRPR